MRPLSFISDSNLARSESSFLICLSTSSYVCTAMFSFSSDSSLAFLNMCCIFSISAFLLPGLRSLTFLRYSSEAPSIWTMMSLLVTSLSCILVKFLLSSPGRVSRMQDKESDDEDDSDIDEISEVPQEANGDADSDSDSEEFQLDGAPETEDVEDEPSRPSTSKRRGRPTTL